MMNVYIALVGAQTMPVYLSVFHTKPDFVVLVASLSTYRKAELLLECLVRDLGKIYSEVKIELFKTKSRIEKIDAVEWTQTKYLAAALYQEFAQDKIFVNITSGTKIWTVLFYKEFSNHEGVEIHYMDQNNTLMNISAETVTRLQYVPLSKLFELYGHTLSDECLSLSEYSDEDYSTAKEIMSIRNRKANAFKMLAALSREENHKVKFFKTSSISKLKNKASVSVNWGQTDKEEEWIDLRITDKFGKYCKHLESPHALSLTFNSGWFEYLTAKAISENQHILSKEAILLNCVFKGAADGNSDHMKDYNEVDVIANMGSKLLFVECKTQTWELTAPDKFAAVVRNYGGMGTKGLFVTYNTMTPDIEEKCSQHKILFFSFDGKMNQQKIDELNEMIDRELNVINEK